MWCLWQEKNVSSFEGCEMTILDLKLLFLKYLYNWMLALGLFSFSTLLDLLNHCTYKFDFDVPIVYLQCTWATLNLINKYR